jgi:hypothetical protein
MPTRRLFLLGTLSLAACASSPPLPAGPTTPLTLDQAFIGRQTGRGVFRIYLTGSERRFTALLNGRLSQHGTRLTVVEDFTYDDGEKNRLTWVFDRTGPSTWTGRREDTVGMATVVEENGSIRLAYTADFKSPSGVNRLGFADIIYRRTDGLIVNDAVVSRSGFPVGSVRFEIGG